MLRVGRGRLGLVAQFPEQAGQRLAADELHGKVVDPVFLADGKDGHDVRVIDLRRGLGFVLEARDLLLVDGCRKGEHFDSHAASQRDLHSLIDDSHAAAADLLHQAEVAELRKAAAGR